MTLPFLQSPPGDEPVIVEGIFAADCARIFRAWTEPEELRCWFGPADALHTVDIDLRDGGHWRLSYHDTGKHRDVLKGVYQSVETNRRLVFTWTHIRTFADGRSEATPESQVTVTFDAHGNSTRLRLVHQSIVREEGRLGVGKGWSMSFARLQALLEENQPA